MLLSIRKLTPQDVVDYKRLRLEALQTDPDSFGSNYARESNFSETEFLSRIEQEDCRYVLGAFNKAELVSTVGIYNTDKNINIWGVYTTPKQRGNGISKNLMKQIISAMADNDNIDKILLGVTSQSGAAQALYKGLGFTIYIDEDDTSCEILMEYEFKR